MVNSTAVLVEVLRDRSRDGDRGRACRFSGESPWVREADLAVPADLGEVLGAPRLAAWDFVDPAQRPGGRSGVRCIYGKRSLRVIPPGAASSALPPSHKARFWRAFRFSLLVRLIPLVERRLASWSSGGDPEEPARGARRVQRHLNPSQTSSGRRNGPRCRQASRPTVIELQ